MMLLSTLPDAETINSYLTLLENRPVLIAILAVGAFGGFILTLAAQHLGWLPDKNATRIAVLELELKMQKEDKAELTEELKKWRRYVEETMDEKMQDSKSNERNN